MNALRLAFAALAALLPTACVTAAGPPPAAYYVTRHHDTPAGERDPDLTPTGRARAERLAAAFPWPAPRAIYVSRFRRTQQTAAPLAARLGLTPILYDQTDTPALLAQVRAGPLPALIVGHSNTVPDIVEQLGGTRPGPIAHEDFGDLWRVEAEGTTTRLRIEG